MSDDEKQDSKAASRPGHASAPLAGVTVLDFSWLLPGPFCGLMLAELGANVIKIESPGGDYARDLFPGMYSVANRGKKGLCIDLKSDGALDLVDRLVAHADVVMEGFRPNVASRLGIGYERLVEKQRGLIYASFSGYGAKGPDAQAPGHDLNYCAASGLLSIPARWGDEPARSGLPLGDLSASLYGAIAILSSLRERDRTGIGAYLDVGMWGCLLNMGQVRFADFLTPGDQGWGHVSPLNDLFDTSDGRKVALGLVEEKFLRAFCRAAGLDEDMLVADLHLFEKKRDDDTANRLRNTIAAAVRTRPAADWERLVDEDVPVSVVLKPCEALKRRQSVEAESVGVSADGVPFVRFPVPGLGQVQMAQAPGRGEHNCQVLDAFGFNDDEVRGLIDRGIVV